MSLAEVYYFNSTVCSAISLCKRLRSVKKTISFMWGCGEESNSCQDHSTSATTQDWELKADLGKQLKYSGNNNLNAGHGADLRSLQAGGSHRGGQLRGKVDESLRNGWRAMCERLRWDAESSQAGSTAGRASRGSAGEGPSNLPPRQLNWLRGVCGSGEESRWWDSATWTQVRA